MRPFIIEGPVSHQTGASPWGGLYISQTLLWILLVYATSTARVGLVVFHRRLIAFCGKRVVAAVPAPVSRGAARLSGWLFAHSTRGHEACIHTLPCWFYEKIEAGLVGRTQASTVGPYGPWLLSMSAGQRGGACYTLAVNVEMGPVFRSHSSQMPLYSVAPPFIPPFCLPFFPPPINDPFV